VSDVFPSSYRIRQSNEFERAFKCKSVSNKWFTIYLMDNNHKTPRLGMIVSKRTISKSVLRNCAKRLIRETFRLNTSKLNSCDYFVLIRRGLTKNNLKEAREALLQLMLIPKL
jgi:ribonuclease P protein component